MKLRIIVAAGLALAACKGKDSSKKTEGETQGTGTGTGTGTSAEVAPDATPPPPVVKLPDALPTSSTPVELEAGVRVFATVDAQGGLAIGVVPADHQTWPTPRSVPDLAALGELAQRLRDGVTAGEDDAALAKRLAAPAPTPAPPPPPPDQEGEAMPKDVVSAEDRAMPPRTRGVPAAPSDEAYAGLGNTPPAAAVPVADRRSAVGLASAEPDAGLRMIVLADAAADARAVLGVLQQADEIAIGVKGAAGGVARFVVRFGAFTPAAAFDPAPELLVDALGSGVTVRSGPGPTHGAAAWTGDAIDAAALGKAYQDGAAGRKDAQVSLGDGVSVAKLVSVIDALVAAGVEEITLRNWTRPELHGPMVSILELDIASGAITTEEILTAVAAQGAALKQCYLEALQAEPATAGRLDVAVILSPGYTVKDVIAQGYDPVAKCTSDAMKTLSISSGQMSEASFHVALSYRLLP